MSVPLPSDSALNQVHPVDASLPPLGHNHGVPISTTAPTRVIVKEKMFSWTGDSYKIKHDDGRAFGSNLYFKAKLFSVRDQIVLMNGLTGKPVCVAKSMFRIGFGEEFRIYTTTPVYDARESRSRNTRIVIFTHTRLLNEVVFRRNKSSVCQRTATPLLTRLTAPETSGPRTVRSKKMVPHVL